MIDNEHGQSLVEYGLIVSLIAIILLACIVVLKSSIYKMYQKDIGHEDGQASVKNATKESGDNYKKSSPEENNSRERRRGEEDEEQEDGKEDKYGNK